MSSPLIGLLSGYFSEELIDERPEMRSDLFASSPDAVAGVRDEFRELLRTRRMSHREFWKATSAWFDNDDKVYRELADSYRFLFAEEPPAPDYDPWRASGRRRPGSRAPKTRSSS